MLRKLIAPDSIAIIGASEDTNKPGGRIIRNILQKGYQGQLLPVNPKASLIQGLPVFSSLKALPQTPDLAFVAIPSKLVASSVAELAELGVKRVIVLSSGFGEIDEQGKREEEKLARIAKENDILLLGPNCLGVMSPVYAGKFAGLLPDMRERGIDFISGSGATVDYLIEQAVKRGLGFHTFATVGNSARVGVADMLALYDEHHEWMSSQFIMLYLEHVEDPRKLLHHARSLSAKGCLLMGIKAGVTEAGSRAAASHTGAMATNDAAVGALFQKAGIIRLRSRLEMVDTAMALTLARGKYDGRRVCVITDAGGPGVMTADELNRQGFSVPPLKPKTREMLAQTLPPGSGLGNPIDCFPTRNAAQISRVIDILNTEEADALDYITLVLGDSGLADNRQIYEALVQYMDGASMPIFPSFCTAISSRTGLEIFRAAGKCYFEDEVSMARAMGRMVNRPKVSEHAPPPAGYDGEKIRALLADVKGPAPVGLTRQALAAAGISSPAQAELHAQDELDELKDVIPFPWVMKVVGPLHKSDVGGVLVGVPSLAEARIAWGKLAHIDGADGILVQQMVEGPEVILGLSKEGNFGHLAAFGLGGVYTEAFSDIQFRLAPLSFEEAREMIQGIKGLPMVQGVRGQTGMDLEAITDLLVRVSLIARDLPQIEEMDINPLKGQGKELFAADARIIMRA